MEKTFQRHKFKKYYKFDFPVSKVVEFTPPAKPGNGDDASSILNFAKALGASSTTITKIKANIDKKLEIMTPIERAVRFGLVLKLNSMIRGLSHAKRYGFGGFKKNLTFKPDVEKFALAGTMKLPCSEDITDPDLCTKDKSLQISPKTAIINAWDGLYGPRDSKGHPTSKVIPVEATFLVPKNCSERGSEVLTKDNQILKIIKGFNRGDTFAAGKYALYENFEVIRTFKEPILQISMSQDKLLVVFGNDDDVKIQSLNNIGDSKNTIEEKIVKMEIS